MPRMKDSDKILKDAKAAATEPVTFGLENGEVPVDDAHTVNNAAFNTGAMYLQSDLNDDEAR
ncbi:MAG TPA: hypothetical protein VNT75_21255 [Symbiobacteriaceae bacterium]|nr:hypothetical protein [Symbiobacteriaceae bacterium]